MWPAPCKAHPYTRLRVVRQARLDAHASTLTEWNRLQTHQDTVARKVLGS